MSSAMGISCPNLSIAVDISRNGAESGPAPLHQQPQMFPPHPQPPVSQVSRPPTATSSSRRCHAHPPPPPAAAGGGDEDLTNFKPVRCRTPGCAREKNNLIGEIGRGISPMRSSPHPENPRTSVGPSRRVGHASLAQRFPLPSPPWGRGVTARARCLQNLQSQRAPFKLF